MASSSYTGDTDDSTVTYSCDTGGIGYSVIGDDIKEDFKFLISDIPDGLDETYAEVEAASAIADAFYFENDSTVCDIDLAREEILNDINDTKTLLETLYDAFMLDIDNVNAELQNNYGWVIGGYLNKKEAKKASSSD